MNPRADGGKVWGDKWGLPGGTPLSLKKPRSRESVSDQQTLLHPVRGRKGWSTSAPSSRLTSAPSWILPAPRVQAL